MGNSSSVQSDLNVLGEETQQSNSENEYNNKSRDMMDKETNMNKEEQSISQETRKDESLYIGNELVRSESRTSVISFNRGSMDENDEIIQHGTKGDDVHYSIKKAKGDGVNSVGSLNSPSKYSVSKLNFKVLNITEKDEKNLPNCYTNGDTNNQSIIQKEMGRSYSNISSMSSSSSSIDSLSVSSSSDPRISFSKSNSNFSNVEVEVDANLESNMDPFSARSTIGLSLSRENSLNKQKVSGQNNPSFTVPLNSLSHKLNSLKQEKFERIRTQSNAVSSTLEREDNDHHITRDGSRSLSSYGSAMRKSPSFFDSLNEDTDDRIKNTDKNAFRDHKDTSNKGKSPSSYANEFQFSPEAKNDDIIDACKNNAVDDVIIRKDNEAVLLESDAYNEKESVQKREKLSYYSKICSEVIPYLFLAGQDVAANRTMLEENNIKYVVNCAGLTVPNYFETDPAYTYLTLNLYDDKKEEISCFIYDVIWFIE